MTRSTVACGFTRVVHTHSGMTKGVYLFLLQPTVRVWIRRQTAVLSSCIYAVKIICWIYLVHLGPPKGNKKEHK